MVKAIVDRTGRSKRVPYRVVVKYGTERPPAFSTFMTNISESGVHINANRVFPPGTKLYFTIDTERGEIEFEGNVAWAKKVPRGFERAVKTGMGISFAPATLKMLALYQEKQNGE